MHILSVYKILRDHFIKLHNCNNGYNLHKEVWVHTHLAPSQGPAAERQECPSQGWTQLAAVLSTP